MPLNGPTRRIVAVGPAKVIRRHEARVGEFGVQQGSGVVENRLIVGGSNQLSNLRCLRELLFCQARPLVPSRLEQYPPQTLLRYRRGSVRECRIDAGPNTWHRWVCSGLNSAKLSKEWLVCLLPRTALLRPRSRLRRWRLRAARSSQTVHEDSSATLGRVVEVVPSFALPVMAAGRIAVCAAAWHGTHRRLLAGVRV